MSRSQICKNRHFLTFLLTVVPLQRMTIPRKQMKILNWFLVQIQKACIWGLMGTRSTHCASLINFGPASCGIVILRGTGMSKICTYMGHQVSIGKPLMSRLKICKNSNFLASGLIVVPPGMMTVPRK